MEFKLKVLPTIYQARTKYELTNKIENSTGLKSWTSGKHIGMCRSNGKKVIVCNFSKINKKTQQTKVPNKRNLSYKDKNGNVVVPKKITKSKIIRHSVWQAYVYTFDISLLELLKIKVTQKKKNFTIKYL